MDIRGVAKVGAVIAVWVLPFVLLVAMALESQAITPSRQVRQPRVVVRMTNWYFWFDVYW